MVTLLCCFLFWTLSTLEASQGSSIISFSPNSPLCIGEEVEMVCFIQSSEQFALNTVQVTINSSADVFSIAQLNTDAIIDGIDLSLYRANTDGLSISTSRPGIRVIIRSYQPSDSNTTFQCHGTFPNASLSAALASGQPMQPAAPPPAPSMLSISSDIDPYTCSATVSLNWIPPTSTDRTVDLYYLSLQNGTALDSISAPANSYSHNTTLLLDTVYAYSVSASSCAGNSTAVTSYLNPVDTPPSPPNSVQSSVSNFNTATCSADISLSWNTPPSNIPVNRYFLYLDGSPLATTNSNSYNHSTILNINTDYQYSVTAMNCAGNSTASSINNPIRIASYSLIKSSQFVCLAYINDTGILIISWELRKPTLLSGVSGLDISYSLQLLYSHSRQGVTYTYTDSTSFTLPSSQLSYNTVLTAHNFTQLDGVETNITANLTIVQQCGQSFSGTTMECFFNSNNPPTPPTPTALTATITQTPTTACKGDTVSVSCGLNVTGGQMFQSIVPCFLIGNSDVAISAKKINDNDPHSGVNLTRLTANTNTGNFTMVSGVVALLSYQTSDEGLRIGCEVLLENGTEIIVDLRLIQQCPKVPSIPPYPLIIGCVVGGVSVILIILIILIVLIIFIQRKRREKEKHTGTDGSDVKNYQELDDTCSEVNKKPKHKPEPVKKDECELNYLEIDHSSGTGKIVKPPIIPKTNYADINSFPQETQYASMQN